MTVRQPGAGSRRGRSTSTVAFTRPDGENMAPPLWAYAPEGWVMRDSASAIDAASAAASLTFRAPAACHASACALVLDADAFADLAVAVNDDTGPRRRGPRLDLASSSLGVADAWVTFTSPSGGAFLGLRVPQHPRGPHRDRLGDVEYVHQPLGRRSRPQRSREPRGRRATDPSPKASRSST